MLVGDALVLPGSVGGYSPVRAIVIGQPEGEVLVIEEQTLKDEELVETGKVVPYLVQKEVPFSGYAAPDVDEPHGVDAHGAGDVDEVLADPDASAQGENLAARASHVEAEAVELEA